MNTMKPIIFHATNPCAVGYWRWQHSLQLDRPCRPVYTVVKHGNTVSYILNQNAASVEVLRNGGNALYPGTNAGACNFDMTGYTTFPKSR